VEAPSRNLLLSSGSPRQQQRLRRMCVGPQTGGHLVRRSLQHLTTGSCVRHRQRTYRKLPQTKTQTK
jgi:hypothetical protein